jgi:lysophospholipase L1-like esterase
LLVLITALLTEVALAQNGAGQEHWVATWTAAPLMPARPALPPPGQTPGPTAAQLAMLNGFNNQTVRMIVHTSLGGRRVRLQLSNAHGSTALNVGAVHIAIRDKNSSIVAASDRAVTFGGKRSYIISAGALAVSDPVDLDVPQLGDLAISVYFPGETGAPTMHTVGLHTTYISKAGDFSGQAEIADAATTQSWYWLSAVDVVAPTDAAAIVAFGDSITDGTRSTPDTDSSWPSVLARRLLASGQGANLAVADQGIAGNRILRDNQGTNALARFDRDVLGQAGVKWMTFLEGINDIGNGNRANALPSDAVSAEDVIGGIQQVIARAHSHGIKIAGCTVLPYSGAAYYSEKGEAVRVAVNRWIRASGAFDAVIDFEAATRDPKSPDHIRMEFDSGDHLHPNDAGYKAMADSIDLSIFSRKSEPRTGAN